MKRILFISLSRLSHNLMRALLPLISKKVSLTCSDGLEEAGGLPKSGTPYRLAIFDWNILSNEKNALNDLDRFSEHRLLKESKKILIHPRQKNIDQEKLREKRFSGFYTKPFLVEELAKIIEENL